MSEIPFPGRSAATGTTGGRYPGVTTAASGAQLDIRPKVMEERRGENHVCLESISHNLRDQYLGLAF